MDPQLLDKTRWPFVGLIRSFFPLMGGGATVGTGSLIHPRVVLTAGHVVFDPGRGGFAAPVTVKLGGLQRVVTSTFLRTTTQWIESDSQTMNPISAFDFGAILLENPIGPSEVPALSFAPTSGPNFAGTLLTDVGYPANFGTFGELYGLSSTPVLSIYDLVRIFYPINTQAGMSGGPVYDTDASGRITMRGIHTSFYKGLGSALRITQPVSDLINQWVAEVA